MCWQNQPPFGCFSWERAAAFLDALSRRSPSHERVGAWLAVPARWRSPSVLRLERGRQLRLDLAAPLHLSHAPPVLAQRHLTLPVQLRQVVWEESHTLAHAGQVVGQGGLHQGLAAQKAGHLDRCCLQSSHRTGWGTRWRPFNFIR